ncbi:MAG TPA: aldo/keto reductase [Alphaproteobacteria bacterium]|nr:aldo/keto reductase [Alphaproteobacteria bacterium]
MQHKAFGATDVALPVIGQGTWDMPESGARKTEAIRAIRRGIELGMTHLDTAEMYGSGAVERLLGEAIAGIARESVFVASKVLPSNASYRGTIEACERSLKNLRLDHLDLYMLHWPSQVPLRETMRALGDLVHAGKTRFVGVSNFDVDEMLEARELLGEIPLACNQVLYHLRERGIEHRLIPAARAANVAIVAYTPFGRGGFPRPSSAGGAVLERVAAKHGATPRQVILAFLTREPNAFTIPKASSVAHVQENAGAGDLRLDASDVEAIDAAFPVGRVGPLATL